ncbi:hypothetical protein Tco_0320733 [Tanacetum coccineum]
MNCYMNATCGLPWITVGKENEFRNTALTQFEKQPPDILTHTQSTGTLEALDNVRIPYAYGCDVSSIGPLTCVSILPFGGVLASEEILNLLDVPSANCSIKNSQLYLNVFQKCSEFCGVNLRRERTIIFRGCKIVFGRLSEVSSWLQGGIPSMDCESRKLKSSESVDVFQAYSALYSRGIGRRRSVNVRRTTIISSCNFIHDNGLRNTGPSTSRADRNARGNPDVGLTTGEATCSRGIGGCRSNFICDNDVRNTGPPTSRVGRNACGNLDVNLTTDVRNTGASTSHAGRNVRRNPDVSLHVCNTSRGGRNTRANPDVGLTTAQASCSSGVTRRHSVRHRPSTRGPTVGSSSASSAGTSYTYTDFGDSDQRCRHCGASFWYGECLKGHS